MLEEDLEITKMRNQMLFEQKRFEEEQARTRVVLEQLQKHKGNSKKK
jgi:hypothetical protein